MPAPRVWSRDDFMEAARMCEHGEHRVYSLSVCERVCGLLEFAERNAALTVDQGRDERGRFLPKPQLHTDSPIVIEARAG